MDRVLIAEDDLKLQKFLRVRLQKHRDKLDIVLANNGEEAIRILEQMEISLLVTDIQMPKLDGLALLAHMNDKHPEVPCIVLTAHPTPEMKQRLPDETFRFFQKPFQLNELVEAIDQALEEDILGGCLSGISVASFLQMIEMEQKTCLLEVTPLGRARGLFYFENGELYDCSYGALTGEPAALELIAVEEAKLRFRSRSKGTTDRQINTELIGLIMEAMRRKDESGG